MVRRQESGFSLIELLITIAIIAIVAVIAIANYFNALARARQKRTMADMRTIAMAWESRASETRSYTAAGLTFPTAVSYQDLSGILVPTYTRNLPTVDGWGRPFEFGASGTTYAIRSAGRDGIFEGTTYTPGEVQNPDGDLVFSNGNFVRYPANIQGE